MIAALIASLAFVAQEPVDIGRVFAKGEKLAYSVDGNLIIEFRVGELKTFLVQEEGVQYDFTGEVTQMKADGICAMRYKRPVMRMTSTTNPEAGPKTTPMKVNFDLLLDVSPINEVLKIEDLAPKKPPKKGSFFAALPVRGMSPPVQTQFQDEIFRLALFVGNLDTSLDFNPKLPLDPVKIGETWKKTVSYQPQVLQGKNKSAVQRLDMTYKYDGVVTNDAGAKVHRVTGTIKLDSDLAPFLNGLMDSTPEKSGLKSMILKLDSTLTFDLDLRTRKTLFAQQESKGEMNVVLTNNTKEPVQEIKLTGRTIMTPKG